MSYRQWEISVTEISEMQQAGLAYWRSLPRQPGTDMPLASDFDLMNIPARILPTTHIVDVIDGGKDFRYRFWGSGFRDFLGYDGTGMSTASLMPIDIREPVRKAYLDVVKARSPLAMLSEFARGGDVQRQGFQGFQQFIRFPLASRDGNVQQVVSLVEFLMDYQQAQKLIADLNNGRH